MNFTKQDMIEFACYYYDKRQMMNISEGLPKVEDVLNEFIKDRR